VDVKVDAGNAQVLAQEKDEDGEKVLKGEKAEGLRGKDTETRQK